MRLAAILITATLAFPGPDWRIDITPALEINVPAYMSTPTGPAIGVALPYVILCDGCPVDHEWAHVRQWALFGPWLAPLYAANRAPFEDYLPGGMLKPPTAAETNLYPLLRVSDRGLELLPGWLEGLP